jgi:hypothetical protein
MSAIRLSVAALAVSVVTLSLTANAASPCKGLAESMCASEQSCRWVGAYTRKDGREVSGYCRLGRAAKPAAEPSADAPTVSSVD